MSVVAESTGVPLAESPAWACSLVVRPAAVTANDPVATLGPEGTSSEAAAEYLASVIGVDGGLHAVTLYSSYEAARDAVLNGQAARLLVANAYHGVNVFYMDQRLELEQAFVFDTPAYGLAARRGAPIPMCSRVITHPAPRDLIRQLAPAGYHVAVVELASSTSAAAAHLASGDADLALTTAPAARLYGLEFISPTRPIRMLWSVFVRRSNTPALLDGST
jgi:prephenate dehydratase